MSFLVTLSGMGAPVMSREAAQRATKVAVESTGMTRKDFAEKAGITVDTLADFIDGKRWAQTPKRNAIEAALGWPLGRIAELAAEVTHIVPASKDGTGSLDSPAVGPDPDDASYVADDTGSPAIALISDEELADRIRAGLEAMDEMRRRTERSARPVDGAQ